MVFPVRRNVHSWDWALVWGMVVFSAGMGALMIKVPQKGIFWTTMLLMGGITAYFAYAVRAMRSLTYSVDRSGIGIHYGFMHMYIPFSDVLAIESSPRAKLGIRLAGTEWPGFYSGYFSEFGEKRIARVYATHKDNVIRITVLQYNYVITPEDSEGFLAEVQSYWHPHPTMRQLQLEAPEGPTIWQTGLGQLGLLLNAAALAGMALYIYHLTTTVAQVPLHYNLKGQVDRYGSPAELYTLLIGPLIVLPIIIYISNLLSRKGVTNKEAAALLLIPLVLTLMMAVISLA